MSTTLETAEAASMAPTQAQSKRPFGGIGFDRIMVLICAWPLLGGYLDGWAHGHLPATTETFYTPWHGVLYSGFLAVGLTLGAVFLRSLLRGVPARRALPHGYGLSLLGFCLVVLGGPGDLLWHSLFGIEVQVEATLSPTHLTLAAAIALIVTGPLRASWVRPEATRAAGWRALFPAILSLALFLSMMTLISQFANPAIAPLAAASQRVVGEAAVFRAQALGVAGIELQTVALMGLLLYGLRRWQLPFGAFTFILTFNSALIATQADQYYMIPVALVTGVVADLLNLALRPSIARPGALRLFAFTVPCTLYLLYFLALELNGGIWWSIHLWLGSAVIAGILGVLLSLLMGPPAVPSESQTLER